MPDEDEDYLENTQERAELIKGRRLTDDELDQEFVKMSEAQRVDFLADRKRHERSRRDEPLTARAAVKELADRRKFDRLNHIHSRLREIDRR